MVRKFQKVLDVMRAKGGRVELNDPDMLAVMGGLTEKHVPSLMWRIRTHAGLEVRGIRSGRKVVAYELVALATPAVTETPADEVQSDIVTETVEASPAS
jgi:hypothetical protein